MRQTPLRVRRPGAQCRGGHHEDQQDHREYQQPDDAVAVMVAGVLVAGAPRRTSRVIAVNARPMSTAAEIASHGSIPGLT